MLLLCKFDLLPTAREGNVFRSLCLFTGESAYSGDLSTSWGGLPRWGVSLVTA